MTMQMLKIKMYFRANSIKPFIKLVSQKPLNINFRTPSSLKFLVTNEIQANAILGKTKILHLICQHALKLSFLMRLLTSIFQLSYNYARKKHGVNQ